ncbi:MAG: hypothetical protein ACREMY_10130, partial [bacterium]
AYTAAVMWDELMNKHTRMFVPTLIRPVQVYTVRQVRTIAAQRLQDAQDGVVVDELAVRAVEQPPA